MRNTTVTLYKMRKIAKFGLFCLLLTLSMVIHAQSRQPVTITITNTRGEAAFSYQADTPDPDMRKVPRAVTALRQKDPVEFIRLLAEYINEKSSSDFERVKKAHDWVALNRLYTASGSTRQR